MTLANYTALMVVTTHGRTSETPPGKGLPTIMNSFTKPGQTFHSS